jgi:two-component sensor histidine kinase
MKLLRYLKSRQALLRQIGENAAQEERNRLARDLHDSIKQQLFSINVSAAAAQERWECDPEGARAMLVDVRRSAKEAMVEMQALLHQLRPEALGSIKGFVEALREQCEALGYRSAVQVTVEIGEEIPDDRLPPGALEALFRIAQEALANVARHARARHVRVGLGLQGEAVVLEVADDGQGFSPGAETSGMGLRNLRERAESLGGILQIASSPGAGTTVKVSLPLTPLLSAEIPAIEAAIDQAVADLFIAVLLVWAFLWMTPPESAYYFGTTLVVLLLGSAAWNRARRARKVPRAAPVDVSRLRHARDRSRAGDLCVAACWAFYIWSLPQNGWNTGRIAWGAMALSCTVLAGLELTRYHRQSRLRSAGPKWTWSSVHKGQSNFFTSLRKYQKTSFVVVLLIIQIILKFQHLAKLGSKQLLCFSFMGAVIVYLFTRQPRMEGAAE